MDKPFTSKHCTPSRYTSPIKQTDPAEQASTTGKFLAQEGVGQALKKFAGNVASKAFGVAGMLLSSQKAYGQGQSGADVATNQYLKNNPDAKQIRSVEDLK